MPEWLWTIIVGGVVMGLFGVVYNSVNTRINKLEEWKDNRPTPKELMTVSHHWEACNANTKELKSFIKEEIDEVKIQISKLNGIK